MLAKETIDQNLTCDVHGTTGHRKAVPHAQGLLLLIPGAQSLLLANSSWLGELSPAGLYMDSFSIPKVCNEVHSTIAHLWYWLRSVCGFNGYITSGNFSRYKWVVWEGKSKCIHPEMGSLTEMGHSAC